jgi:hypothetical protein
MSLSTIIAWFTWIFVIFNIDPFETSVLGIIFFFFSLSIGLIGLLSLVILAIYYFFGNEDLPIFRYVSISFKQSFIISFFLILFLILQINALLNILNFTILLFILILFISLTISIRKKEKIEIEEL